MWMVLEFAVRTLWHVIGEIFNKLEDVAGLVEALLG
jgi:hypothetical protein